jgi:hypothetical protein
MIWRGGLVDLVLVAAFATHSVGTNKGTPPRAAAQDTASAAHGKVVPRNPSTLRASQLLERRPPGTLPRVRFEWDQVRGATQYLLSGQWTTPPSWTVQSREHRVTASVATSWGASHVSFDVSLPEGSHSWRLVALFGPRDIGDFEHPTTASFDVR